MTPLAHRLHSPLATEDLGERVVLVLLHAYPLDSSMWDSVISHLHEEDPSLPILTIDAPGFGDSPTGPEVAAMVEREPAPSLETFAHGIEAILESIGINNIVLAGLSLGGYAALAYAELFPERIRGLGLLDTKAEADEEPARKVRLSTAVRVLEQGTAVIEDSVNTVLGETTLNTAPEVVEALRREIVGAPPAGIAWIQRAMAARPDRLHVLESLNRSSRSSVPLLVLRGEEDVLSTHDSARAMLSAAATGSPAEHESQTTARTLVTLPRVGHMSANEAPKQVAQALTALYGRSLRVD